VRLEPKKFKGHRGARCLEFKECGAASDRAAAAVAAAMVGADPTAASARLFGGREGGKEGAHEGELGQRSRCLAQRRTWIAAATR
jgi:hypothetical protein